jgi:ArsR family metal-binding transcriptional regulator
MPKCVPEFEEEVRRRMAVDNVALRRIPRPRRIGREADGLRERVQQKKKADDLRKALPRLDCGLCGAPTCASLAEDVAAGRAEIGECVFLSPDRILTLRALYTEHHPTG